MGETSEQVLRHVALVRGRITIVEYGVVGRHRVGARFQFREASVDLGFKAARIFPEVLLHLGVDEPCDLALMVAKHFCCLALREVAFKVRHGLCCKVVEQVGMVIVGDVVEVHQAADDIVFQSLLLNASDSNGNQLSLACAEILTP